MKNLFFKLTAAFCILNTSYDILAEQVIVNEVMYNPKMGEPEWIELANITATPFDIANWKLRGNVELDFPQFDKVNASDSFLKHWQKIILTNISAEEFRVLYGVPSSVMALGPWNGNLPNEGGRITLKDRNGVQVCTLGYNDSGRWPVAADGTGHALVLKDQNQPVDDWRNWTFSKRTGGTPGGDPVAGAETPVDSPEVDLSSGVVLLDYGDRWKYNDQNKSLGTAWRRNSYNDSTWESGEGLLGVESAGLPGPGLKTTINKGSQLTYYFRKEFIFNSDPSGVTLTIDQIVDDGAVYYLNGQEVGRSRVNGSVNFNTTSSATVSDAAEEKGVVTIDSGLKKGSNVLAVEVHQTNRTSSDIVFGCRLRASMPASNGVVINEIYPVSGQDGYIEFYNPTTELIDLKGFYLSDDPSKLDKQKINRVFKVQPKSLAKLSFASAKLSINTPVIV